MKEEEKMLRSNILLLVLNSVWTGVLLGVVAFGVRVNGYLVIAVSLLLLAPIVWMRIRMMMYRERQRGI